MVWRCLSVAGLDGSGSAGMQADLKVFAALGCDGMSVLTAVPVQNTCGVRACDALPTSCVREQWHAIFDHIQADAIKVGRLFSSEVIDVVASVLEERARDIPIVLDPVMVAKRGHRLLQDDAVDALVECMVPQATLITPNLPEAQVLAGGTLHRSNAHASMEALGDA